MLFYVIPAILLILHLILFWIFRFRLNPGLPKKIFSALINVHWITLGILTLLIFLFELWKIRPIFLGLSRSLIGLYILTGFSIVYFQKEPFKKAIYRFYFQTLNIIPVLIFLFTSLSFIGTLFSLTILGKFTQAFERPVYKDKQVLLQSTFEGPLGPPRLDLYKKQGLIFEKRIHRFSYFGYSIDSIDSTKINHFQDSLQIILFYEDSLQLKKSIYFK